MVAPGANPLLRLVESGRVKTLAQLRGAYRTLVLKTHPDAVGSERLLDKYLALSAQYEEARAAFEHPGQQAGASGPPAPSARSAPAEPGPRKTENHRLAYYGVLYQLERLDKPYSFHRDRNRTRIHQLKSEARSHFQCWSPDRVRLFDAADRDYDRLKAEKLRGPYLQDALALNVGPVFHNIVAFHLTGSSFYRSQVRQNLPAVLQKLADRHCTALRGFVEVLIDDMKDGPAVFDVRRAPPVRRLPAARSRG